MSKSDGSTADYYKLPANATELQHLISYRNLNAQDGEMFRAIYRKGRASHSDALRDARKVLFYAKAEVERLEALYAQPDRADLGDFGQQNMHDFDEDRVDRVASSHGDGEHYDAICSDNSKLCTFCGAKAADGIFLIHLPGCNAKEPKGF